MFDLTSTKLLILGVVALLVVGPKDLPVLLRTVGKYMGILRRQAAEFRSQFDEAMRESELADLKKEVENISNEAQSTLSEAQRTVSSEVGSFNHSLDETVGDIAKSDVPPPELAKLPDFPTPELPMPELPTKAPDIAALAGAPAAAAADLAQAQAAAHEPAPAAATGTETAHAKSGA